MARDKAAEIAQALETPEARHRTVQELDVMVELEAGSVMISLALDALDPSEQHDHRQRHILVVPARLARRGQELRMAYPPSDQRAPIEPNVKAHRADRQSRSCASRTCIGAADRKVRRAHLTRLARLKYLAPDIVGAILKGRQPVELSARKLLRAETIPLDWGQQRRALGFG